MVFGLESVSHTESVLCSHCIVCFFSSLNFYWTCRKLFSVIELDGKTFHEDENLSYAEPTKAKVSQT